MDAKQGIDHKIAERQRCSETHVFGMRLMIQEVARSREA